ncbi:hypothetical protein TNCV_958681 [Trichonephila clavipes]|nr:hypothetical protein TNCV_958681 [Trichonephila clavipes]
MDFYELSNCQLLIERIQQFPKGITLDASKFINLQVGQFLQSHYQFHLASVPTPPEFQCDGGREDESTRFENCLTPGAVGSLVIGASDSRPQGLGSMPDATKYLPSKHGVRAP